MELDRVAIELRPRSGWEAVDVGIRLARRSYLRLVAIALAITLPLYALSIALFWSWPLLLWLLPWWSKPVWERPLLHVVSREFFGEPVGVREGIASLRHSWRRDVLPWLTIRRLSPTRCMDLPVTVLEGSTGEARAKRVTLLRQGPLSTSAFWLTVVGAHLEFLLPIAALTLVDLLVPEFVDWSAWSSYMVDVEEGSALGNVVGGLMSVCAAVLVAPFYVAGGFSLYVHRRTVLEGWDLQIAFTRLARRLAGVGRVAALLALALLVAATTPGAPRAEGLHAAPGGELVVAARDEARDGIDQVLAREEFHQIQTWRIPRFLRDWPLDFERDEPWRLPSWVRAVFAFMAGSIEVIVAALVLAVLLYVAWRLRGVDVPAPPRPGARRRPTRILGLDLADASLPADVIAAASAEWRAGRPRHAMALLYRASLIRLIDLHEVELRESDTEAQCLRAARVRMRGEPLAAFAEITRAWSMVAYGHRPLEDAAFEAMLAGFERHLTIAPARAPEHG